MKDMRSKLIDYLSKNLSDDDVETLYNMIKDKDAKGEFVCQYDGDNVEKLVELGDKYLNKFDSLWNDRNVLRDFEMHLELVEKENNIFMDLYLTNDGGNSVPYQLEQVINTKNANSSYNSSFSSLALHINDTNDMEYFNSVDELLSKIEKVFGEFSAFIISLFYK